MQNYYYCHCGHAYGERRSSSYCDTYCAGKRSETCGGKYSLSLYSGSFQSGSLQLANCLINSSVLPANPLNFIFVRLLTVWVRSFTDLPDTDNIVPFKNTTPNNQSKKGKIRRGFTLRQRSNCSPKPKPCLLPKCFGYSSSMQY